MRRLFSKIIFNSSLIFLIILLVFLVSLFLKTSFTFSKITSGTERKESSSPLYLLPELEDLPEKNEQRLNFLLLGIRGEGKPFGGLLTDAIMIVSLEKEKHQVALISLPRDLYVPLPDSSHRDKINAVYAWGYSKGGVQKGLAYVKDIVSRITGLYIEHAIVVNFDAFEQFVDLIGGVEIYLKNDFLEDKQWGCDAEGKNCWKFFLPAGKNTLDGKTALFYLRSRFSSSDFDRAYRAQKVFLAIKDKIFSLGFLANPVKVFNTLEILGNNIRTDMTLSELKAVISLARSNNFTLRETKSLVFSTEPDGLLYPRYLKGRYILLPKAGDFSEVRRACQEVFD